MQRRTPTPRDQQKNPQMPDSLRRYFWDIDFSDLDPQKYSTYVIERVLDLGDVDAIAWLKKEYQPNKITAVIKKTRQLSPKSANFWTIIYNLNPKGVLCMSKSFQERRKIFWR